MKYLLTTILFVCLLSSTVYGQEKVKRHATFINLGILERSLSQEVYTNEAIRFRFNASYLKSFCFMCDQSPTDAYSLGADVVTLTSTKKKSLELLIGVLFRISEVKNGPNDLKFPKTKLRLELGYRYTSEKGIFRMGVGAPSILYISFGIRF